MYSKKKLCVYVYLYENVNKKVKKQKKQKNIGQFIRKTWNYVFWSCLFLSIFEMKLELQNAPDCTDLHLHFKIVRWGMPPDINWVDFPLFGLHSIPPLFHRIWSLMLYQLSHPVTCWIWFLLVNWLIEAMTACCLGMCRLMAGDSRNKVGEGLID